MPIGIRHERPAAQGVRSGADGTGKPTACPEDTLRRDLGRLVRQLLEDRPRTERDSVRTLIRAHLGSDGDEFPIYTEEMEGWELPNLQLALDAMNAHADADVRVIGLGGQARHYGDLSLGTLQTADHFGTGPAEYVNVPVGPERTLACLELAVLLVTTPHGPVAALLHRGDEHQMGPALAVQATAPADGLASRFLADLRTEMDAQDVYRGQVITVEATRHGGSRIAFLERPSMARAELILPDGTLERIESTCSGPPVIGERDYVAGSGRHLFTATGIRFAVVICSTRRSAIPRSPARPRSRAPMWCSCLTTS